ncbi:winged helix-turn-helix transcriptional regulator [Halosimplex marinum]|uniref:winged helix-turn-helix transcriptional regulator n=1 Tax=Halosimplex marinum TaxID=3396620 RepID=UPI003F56BC4B
MASTDDCVAGWCADDDWCALTCAAGVLDGKWHPVIVARLLDDGPLGFNRLGEAIDGVSDTVLSDSLDSLEADGVVDREVVSERPYRVEYSLTDRGADLEPVIAALREWGADHATADDSTADGSTTGCD